MAQSNRSIAAAAAIAVSDLSRRYFEEPFLRLKDSLGPERPARTAEISSTGAVADPPA
jgi:hypothetical protein